MREKHIDLLRQVALFYMFFQHSVLGLLKLSSNKGIIFFIFELVPICPALFLFLAGYSLSLSYKKSEASDKKLFFIKIKKIMFLIFSGEFLFVIENGFQFPDFLISPNILFTIGLMMLSGLFFLYNKNGIFFLSVLIPLLIILTLFLEYFQIFILPFNSGYEPWSPTIIFGYIGLLIGMIKNSLMKENNKDKILSIISGLSGIIILLPFIFKGGLFKALATETGRYSISRAFNYSYNLLTLFSPKNSFYFISVWNFAYSSFFVSLGFVLILYSSGSLIKIFLDKYLPDTIFIPGKFALANYFFHLSIIGICILIFGENSFGTFSFLAFLLLLYILSYILSYALDKYKKISPGHLSGM